MDAGTAEARLLDAAGALFNARGVQAVGMDAIRTASGVSLKRLYQLFPSKDDLVSAVLTSRSQAVAEGIAAHARPDATPSERILDVFDYLEEWFTTPDFRGCALINSYGELGGVSHAVATIVRSHTQALTAHFATLVAAAGGPPPLADQLALLANGAMATAGILGTPEPARQARTAAEALMAAAPTQAPRAAT
ncbi:TetR/AcrR family transcriptional regulator [Kitasatospora aureofaciens]|uniref:TetR/AcrR family transcriptional regulator n=1 Tax=Kitasatospora aureofaciens TaxID=1894 RepID=UPI001C44E359|nr:TetR/AcrR family transcriptional regulator [Kitasatospora aureofaciens]MBV6699936.1 TetR/AcrR family transcriptional regulator [Kitasatospora aureofaciens]